MDAICPRLGMTALAYWIVCPGNPRVAVSLDWQKAGRRQRPAFSMRTATKSCRFNHRDAVSSMRRGFGKTGSNNSLLRFVPRGGWLVKIVKMW